jgi:hypothetical protein
VCNSERVAHGATRGYTVLRGVGVASPGMSDPTPDNTLPGDLPDDEDDDDLEIGNQLPEDVPSGQDPGKVRGKSAQAPGRNKPEQR